MRVRLSRSFYPLLARRDRYLVLVGGVSSVIAALPQFTSTSGVTLPGMAYALLFGLLGVVGLFTMLKLVRLRQAWYESALAMSKIKDFYLEQFKYLENAFRWRTDTIPSPNKLWTITFYLALLVMIIDSVAVGVAAYFLDPGMLFGEYGVAIIVALVFLVGQLGLYFFQLTTNR